MIPKHLTTAAAVASATLFSASTVSGFLIPPELSDTDIAFAQEVASDLNPDNKLDPIIASASQHQLLELACPGCPVLIKDRHHNAHHPKVLTDKPNHLELDFKIDHVSSGDRLLVNGFELFPNADPLRSELWAGQVLEQSDVRTGKVEDMPHAEDDSDSEHENDDHQKHKNRKHKNRKHRNHKPKTIPQNLGFGLRTTSSQPSSDPAEQAQEIIDLNLQILEVGNAFVQGIPAVEIKLLRDQVTNKLMIAGIDTAASNEDNGLPVPFMGVAPDQKPEPECDSFLCKLLEGFREKVKEGKEAWEKKMGGCHGQPATPYVEEGAEDQREMPVVEIDIERINFDGEDGTWEIVAAPVEEQEEEEKEIKDLLDEVPQQEDESPEGQHGGWHGHHHGGMHRYEHNWGSLLKSITAHVLLPVLVGIVAGVSVSFIGMAFGTLIVALYRFFYRRGGSSGCRGRKCRRNGGAGCKRSRRHGKDEAEAPVEEKAGLLNAQEPEAEGEAPPAYEDAKVAEEGEVRK